MSDDMQIQNSADRFVANMMQAAKSRPGDRIARSIRELIVHVHETNGGEFGGHEFYGLREGSRLEQELADAINEMLGSADE